MGYTLVGRKDYIQSCWMSMRLTQIYFLGLLVATLHLGMLTKTQTTPFRKLSMPKMHFLAPMFSDGRSHRKDYYVYFSEQRNQELTYLLYENIGGLCFVVCFCSVKSMGDGFVLSRNGKCHFYFCLCVCFWLCQWQ